MIWALINVAGYPRSPHSVQGICSSPLFIGYPVQQKARLAYEQIALFNPLLAGLEVRILDNSRPVDWVGFPAALPERDVSAQGDQPEMTGARFPP